EITYWIDKNFWGRKIATRALKAFLALEPARPLIGRAAFDNFGSQKVLERCGFVRVGTDRGYANARQAEIEEFIYQLTTRLAYRRPCDVWSDLPDLPPAFRTNKPRHETVAPHRQ